MHLEADLPRISSQIPILLCYGSWDRLAPLSHGRRLHKHLPSSHLVEFPRETHFTTLFAPPCEAEIIRWISEHSSPR
jgi:pimeloyl-ACP methyl ester carboxylesterase